METCWTTEYISEVIAMLITLLCCGRYLLQRRNTYWNRISSLKLLIDIIFRRTTTTPGQVMESVDCQNTGVANKNDEEQELQVTCGGVDDKEDRLQQMFDAAVKVIQRLPKDGPYQPSNSTKLRFYSLYKQVTEGKCTQSQPYRFQMVDRAKWDAWNCLGDMTKVDAMTEYVEELKKIVETMSFSGEVQEFLDTVNPFYEFVALQGQGEEKISNVKESLDQNQWNSSDTDVSSSNTSVHPTPIHIPEQNVTSTFITSNGWPKHNELGNGNVSAGNGRYLMANGHVPLDMDKESLELEDTLNVDKESLEDSPTKINRHSFASSFHPPSAPIHRRSITGCTSSDFDDSFRPVAEDAKHEDVLKVDLDESQAVTSLTARLSADNLTSPSESERYYSGESEPDIDSTIKTAPPEPLYSLPGSSSSTVRFRQNTTIEVNRILQNTVDRLNRDVDHIVARIRLLEAAYATNEQLNLTNSLVNRRRSIFGVSRSALVLILTWPFVAFFIIELVKRWLRRRRRGRF